MRNGLGVKEVCLFTLSSLYHFLLCSTIHPVILAPLCLRCSVQAMLGDVTEATESGNEEKLVTTLKDSVFSAADVLGENASYYIKTLKTVEVSSVSCCQDQCHWSELPRALLPVCDNMLQTRIQFLI